MIRVREFAGGNPHNPHENPHATGAPKVYVGDFWGGALPWKSSENQKYDFTLGFLNWLQHPLGRSWSMDLGGKANIEVVDFLPHARREAFSPTERGFPALKIYLKGKFGMPSEPWLAGNLEDRQYSPGPALVEFLGRCPTLMVTEFLNPPALDELGKQGVLVAHVDGKMARIPVDASLGKTVSLGGGFDVKIDKFVSNWREEEGPAEDPGLEFEVYKNGKKEGTFLVLARFTGLVLDKNKKGIFPQGQRGMPTFWYHPADVRWGNDRYRGVLQFVQGDDGRLYFRSFKHQDQGFGKETSGEVSANRKENPIWGKMQFSFRVLEHLPDATKKERYFPVNLVPGKETEEDKLRYPEVILCRVSDGKDTKEIWVGKSMGARRVLVNGKTYAIEYTIKQIKLPFTIKLERAEQTVDPGTRAAASYTSFVQLFDQEKKINGERRQITMNEPLEHRGYKFYQSTYQFLDAWDANGKPVSVSGFTVGHDPGLSLKYLGSLMLGLGIACMFYMKAYFFKPRGRKAPASLPPSQPA